MNDATAPHRPASQAGITIHKLDHDGRETWHYTGVVLDRGPAFVQLEARFNAADRDLGYTVFRRGDRFVEWFFADRWYNIFEVHAVEDDRLRGWYCNLTRPAVLEADHIYADDLALDLWVAPDGAMLTLDEDEFAALNLDAQTQSEALAQFDALRALVAARAAPFDRITG
jgi:protein associated with RNAse G/E